MEDRQEQEFWSKILAALYPYARADRSSEPEPPPVCYRCGAAEDFVYVCGEKSVCRPCGLAIRAVLKAVPGEERDAREKARAFAAHEEGTAGPVAEPNGIRATLTIGGVTQEVIIPGTCGPGFNFRSAGAGESRS